MTSNKLDIEAEIEADIREDIEADTQVCPCSLYDLDDDVKKT